VEHALFGRLHAGHAAAVVQHASDVGIDEDVDAVLPRTFHVGIGETERADLVVAEKFQCPTSLMTDARLGFAQCGLIEPAHLIGQMRNAADNVLGVEPVFVVINDELQSGLFKLEIHPVLVLQLAMQRRVQRVGLQGEIEERLRQDMRRAGVHRDGCALGFAFAVGRHHPEENHPAPQPHRLADGPQAAGRSAGCVARAFGVDQRHLEVLALGQLIGAGRPDHAAASNDHVIELTHGKRPPCRRTGTRKKESDRSGNAGATSRRPCARLPGAGDRCSSRRTSGPDNRPC